MQEYYISKYIDLGGLKMYDYNPYVQDYAFPPLKLAQAYVPLQKYVSIYPPEEAIKKGTVFPELDMPYVGEKMR